MFMEIRIEAASVRLLEKLFKIEQECFDQEAFTKQQLAYLLTDYNTVGLVAKVGDDIAGFILSQIEVDNKSLYGHIITLNVALAFRRKGVGSKLLRETEQIFKDRGIMDCHLEVREDNTAALGLYEKIGYRQISKLYNYYGNKNGFLLQKSL